MLDARRPAPAPRSAATTSSSSRLRGRALPPLLTRRRLTQPPLARHVPQRRPLRQRSRSRHGRSEGATRLGEGRPGRSRLRLARPSHPLDEHELSAGRRRRQERAAPGSSTGPFRAHRRQAASPCRDSLDYAPLPGQRFPRLLVIPLAALALLAVALPLLRRRSTRRAGNRLSPLTHDGKEPRS